MLLISAPDKPVVTVNGITNTSFIVKWTKSDVRPGITSYIIDVISTVTQEGTHLDKSHTVTGKK